MALCTNWMKNLDPKLKDISICYLAIPGSHDSLSYSVTSDSEIAPDAPKVAKIFNKVLGRFMRKITYNWCLTQTLNIQDQFKYGIRYFDLRIAKKGTHFFSCHGLYGMCIFKAMEELNACLEANPEEVVILDFQHFYDLNFSDHLFLLGKIHSIFQSKICPEPEDVENVTLNWMRDRNYQVIGVYRNPIQPAISGFWSSSRWVTLWPDTTNLKTLLQFLVETLKRRPYNTGFVSQCVFTPSSKYITFHLFSSLKKKCSLNCDLEIKSMWIKNQKCLYSKGVNVILADFVDIPDFDFCSTVVKLNYESLK